MMAIFPYYNQTRVIKSSKFYDKITSRLNIIEQKAKKKMKKSNLNKVKYFGKYLIEGTEEYELYMNGNL